MTDKTSVIVFSPPLVDLVDNKFFIKAEDADGKCWDLIGPISDEKVAILIRATLRELEDGWGYLSALRDAISDTSPGSD
ncbi:MULTISPECIES: hypothetical protein [Brucella/Ochrobactrum group]|jgi:hypothetical protein|uniref:hypothetical protein n=1 Tax=Brucella/Ochrobactrum group TaxID=2826938 RepID=UPI001C05C761|nr:hypothetical protein [Brucella sp. NBRC 12950]QWK80493.1 hypothetical protein KMS41_22440 [Ochrobactrum sp. BTU1]GLU28951.1 hypothetical protein Brsp01_41840 [Brucella sp. NBRC 12950]